MSIMPQCKKKQKTNKKSSKADGDMSEIILQKASTIHFSFPVPS